GFPDFVAGFEPCKDLPYLADVGRFEWALNTAATMRKAPPLKIEALAGIAPKRAALLKISLQPSVNYFASGWPIDAIWLANQHEEVPMLDLASGGTTADSEGSRPRIRDHVAHHSGWLWIGLAT